MKQSGRKKRVEQNTQNIRLKTLRRRHFSTVPTDVVTFVLLKVMYMVYLVVFKRIIKAKHKQTNKNINKNSKYNHRKKIASILRTRGMLLSLVKKFRTIRYVFAVLFMRT